MSSTTSSTTAIDDKKNDTTNTSSTPINYGGFIRGLISSSLQVIFFVGFVGSIGLYKAKIAQANILPDNLDLQPFGTDSRNLPNTPININIINKYGFYGFGMFLGQAPQETLSTKVYFDNNEILKAYDKGFVGFINSFQNNPSRASFLGLYFRNIIFEMMAVNNSITNNIFNVLNQYLSESVILLLYPMISFLFFFIYLIVNNVLCFFYQLKEWYAFFMNKSEKDNKVKWVKPLTYLRPWRCFLYLLYLFFFFIPVLLTLPFIITLYSIFAPLFIPCKIVGTNQSLSFLTFCRDVILFKSQLFLLLLSLVLLGQSASSLGTNGVIGCLVGICIVFFFLHLYNQFIPTNDKSETEGLASNKQAKVQKGGKKKK